MPRHVPLGELLQRSRVPVAIEPDREYKQVTVRMHRRGATLRQMALGSTMASSQYLARAGQVIVSRIDARHGALATVPAELDGAVVTSDFWLFEVGDVDRDYLERYFDTTSFLRACERASSGSTNRVRLQEDRFSGIPIPVPESREEQRVLVDRADRRLAVVQEARRLSERNERDADVLYQAGIRTTLESGPPSPEGEVHALLAQYRAAHAEIEEPRSNNAHPGEVPSPVEALFDLPAGWTWVPLGACCTHIIDCVNDTPDFSPRPTGFIGLKTTNIRANRLVLDETWHISEQDFAAWNRRAAPRAGDLVLTREAPMGFVCALPEEPRVCLTQRLVLLRADPAFVRSDYLVHVLNDFLLMDQARALSKSTPPHMRVRDLPRLAVPLCDQATQTKIAGALDSLFATTVAMRGEMAEQALDLVALERAVLNQTFEPVAA